MSEENRPVVALGMEMRDLGRQLRQDFDEQHPDWLYAAVESLRKDGLARADQAQETGSALGMVAEERAPYGNGSVQAQGRWLDRSVRLP